MPEKDSTILYHAECARPFAKLTSSRFFLHYISFIIVVVVAAAAVSIFKVRRNTRYRDQKLRQEHPLGLSAK